MERPERLHWRRPCIVLGLAVGLVLNAGCSNKIEIDSHPAPSQTTAEATALPPDTMDVTFRVEPNADKIRAQKQQQVGSVAVSVILSEPLTIESTTGKSYQVTMQIPESADARAQTIVITRDAVGSGADIGVIGN